MSFFEIENLSLSFGGVKAVDDVSFAMNEGEVFTIVGPNGAGKSTVFNMISSFTRLMAAKFVSKAKTLLRRAPTRLPVSALPAHFKISNCLNIRPYCKICLSGAKFTVACRCCAS